MADKDVAIITVNGKTVRIMKEDFEFILISAQVELNRHKHELDKELHASSALQWTDEMLQHMFK